MNARLSAPAAAAAVTRAALLPPVMPAITTGTTRTMAGVPWVADAPTAFSAAAPTHTSTTPVKIPTTVLGWRIPDGGICPLSRMPARRRTPRPVAARLAALTQLEAVSDRPLDLAQRARVGNLPA